MKKNALLQKHWPCYALSKTLMTMKLITILTIVSLFQITASTYSQNTRLSLKFEKLSLENVFREIEENSEFSIFYKNELIQNSSIINASYTNASISEILNSVLASANLDYIVKDKLILIVPKDYLNLQSGQPIRINGIVSDAVSGEPLLGVNVIIEGTTIGTTTDANGRYSIDVPGQNVVLIFSYIGYLSERVTASSANLDIKLSPDLTKLDEVVVVGYGVVKKSDLTGSVSSISAKDYERQAVVDVSNILKGRSAGVTVSNNSGAPGGFTKIRIRGNNSFTGGNDPLFVVDGMQLSGIDLLSVNDIENIEILKDASATAIYGSRGANGVIMVTTKKGSKEKTKTEFTTNLGISKIAYKYNLLDPVSYAELHNQSSPNSFTSEEIAKLRAGGGTDWQDAVFRTAKSQDYQLSFSGGTKNSKYYLSGRYLNQEGIVINTKLKKYTFNANVETDLTKKLKVSGGAILSRGEGLNNQNMGGLSQPLQGILIWGPSESIYNSNGTYQIADRYGAFPTVKNPVANLNTAGEKNTSNNILLNTKLSYQIFSFLTLDIVSGLNANFNDHGSVVTPYQPYSDSYSSSRSNNESLYLQNSNILTFHKLFGQHELTIAGVYEQSKGYSDHYNVGGGLIYPNLEYYSLGTNTAVRAGSYFSKYQLISGVGRLNYSFKGKYLVTATFRADGASRFPNNHWGYFPSYALGWKASEESFIKELNIFNNLKLRGSWGVTGNQAVVPFLTISRMVNGTYGHGENRPDMVYYDPANQLADANLRWEQTAQTDLGFDMSLLENRLGISFDYFIKKTKDLLMNTPLPLYQGGLTRRDSNFGTVLKNVGSVENKGYEFVVNYIPIDTKNITWNVGFNFSAYKNKVTGLGNTEYVEGANGGGVAGNAAPLTRTIVGEPLGTFYGFKFLGIYQENEAAEAAKFGFKPGDSKYFDKNNDNKIDSEDKVVIGHGIPKYSWGLDNTFRYKDFELNLFLQAVSGNDLFNLDYQSTSTIFLDHRAITSADVTPWTAENKNNMWPKLGSSTNNEFLNSSKWVQDGSFIRVKNLSLGYRLPAALTHGASLKLMVSAQNLLTITKFKGYDPEATTTVDDLNPGIVFGAYPSARTFLFTLQLSM